MTAPAAPTKGRTMTDWLTPSEAGEFSRLSIGHLANLRCKGLGPKYFRVGRAIRYRVEDIESWMTTGPAA